MHKAPLLIKQRLSDALRDEQRRAARLFSAAFNESPEAIALSRFSDGLIMDVNQEWLRFTGFSRDEVVGHTTVEIGHWSDSAARETAMTALITQRRLRDLEVMLTMKDGSQRLGRLNGSIIEVSGEQLILMYVKDVTSEHEAKRALQDQLAFIRKITSLVPGLVFQFLLRPDGSSCFPYASEAIRDMFGVSPQEARRDATAVFAVVHPADLAGLRNSMQASARDMTPWNHEFRVKFANGALHWFLGNAVPQREPDGSVVSYGALTDITGRKQAETLLQESEARFRSLTELSSDWYWELDEEFRFVRLDGGLVAAIDTTGVSRAGLTDTGLTRIGRTRWDIGALNMRAPADWDAHRAVLEAHETFHNFELLSLDVEGHKYWMSLSGTPIFGVQGEFRGYRGVGRNISERKRAEKKIERLAFYDVLTGLPNRHLLASRLQHALASCVRDHLSGALLFIDLDNFKDLNDTQGHDVGDQLLQQVASRLSSSVRGVDTVSRLGGDEFVVLLEKLSQTPDEAAAQAEAVGKKIIANLNQPYVLAEREHHSTPSMGITLFQDHQQGVDELLQRADLAMYEAKAAGRNTLRFFDPAMQAVVATRTVMEADLRQGLQRQELRLYYQPVVDAAGVVMGVEALVRWQHPQRGLVAPGDFIPLAEQSGLILPLGQWVLETACAQLVTWSSQPATNCLSIAVNVSARQFRQPDFADQVLDLLQKTGANPYRLKLEITESLLLSDVEDAIKKMSELRSVGVGFSLDDFGTGYSSLSYLKRLPLDQLKIDQSFVRDVLVDPNDAAIIKTILALAQSLDLAVVAEGVETSGQRDFLLDHGCKIFQGYLFGRPGPIEALLLPIIPPGFAMNPHSRL